MYCRLCLTKSNTISTDLSSMQKEYFRQESNISLNMHVAFLFMWIRHAIT